jgi:hypothetical protein
MTDETDKGGAASGPSDKGKDQETDVKAVGGKTATSTPLPGESKSASPGMKEQPDNGAESKPQ